MGEMKFKQRPREEQAEADGTSEAEKVGLLFMVLLSYLHCTRHLIYSVTLETLRRECILVSL